MSTFGSQLQTSFETWNQVPLFCHVRMLVSTDSIFEHAYYVMHALLSEPIAQSQSQRQMVRFLWSGTSSLQLLVLFAELSFFILF